MRDIKFRAKALCDNEFVYGDIIHYNRDPRREKWVIQEPETGIGSDVDEDTIGQFTGMKDKNGKEIYEGDVVRWVELRCDDDLTEPSSYFFREETSIVNFENGIFGVKNEDVFDVLPLCYLTENYFTSDQDFTEEDFKEALGYCNMQNPPRSLKDIYMVEVVGNKYDNTDMLE